MSRKPKAWSVSPVGGPCRFYDCPPGLFIYLGKHLAMCTEYHEPDGTPEAYIIASGERYCGNVGDLVQPCKTVGAPLPMAREVARALKAARAVNSWWLTAYRIVVGAKLGSGSAFSDLEDALTARDRARKGRK